MAKQKSFWEQNKVNIIGWLVIVVVIAGLIFASFTAQQQYQQTLAEVLGVSDSDNYKGTLDSPVTLIEYADFQCPACAGYKDVIDQLVAQNPDDLVLVYRHLPLVSIHPNAVPAAIAAEAAKEQDAFWGMYDLLYSGQSIWSELDDPTPIFLAYAEQLDLDADKFAADLENETVIARVDADLQQAGELGLNSTPTFFMNGEKIQLGSSLSAFQDLVDQALGK